ISVNRESCCPWLSFSLLPGKRTTRFVETSRCQLCASFLPWVFSFCSQQQKPKKRPSVCLIGPVQRSLTRSVPRTAKCSPTPACLKPTRKTA
ncbi:hypothetical protein BaRGS_00036448, partial [Batillaria attramentaria]